jgi:hypothetical protein
VTRRQPFFFHQRPTTSTPHPLPSIALALQSPHAHRQHASPISCFARALIPRVLESWPVSLISRFCTSPPSRRSTRLSPIPTARQPRYRPDFPHHQIASSTSPSPSAHCLSLCRWLLRLRMMALPQKWPRLSCRNPSSTSTSDPSTPSFRLLCATVETPCLRPGLFECPCVPSDGLFRIHTPC